MAKYRNKPVVVEAVKYDPPTNCEEVWKFMGWPWPQPDPLKQCHHSDEDCDDTLELYIDTPDGLTEVEPGHYIVKGPGGDFHTNLPDDFDADYEAI